MLVFGRVPLSICIWRMPAVHPMPMQSTATPNLAPYSRCPQETLRHFYPSRNGEFRWIQWLAESQALLKKRNHQYLLYLQVSWLKTMSSLDMAWLTLQGAYIQTGTSKCVLVVQCGPSYCLVLWFTYSSYSKLRCSSSQTVSLQLKNNNNNNNKKYKFTVDFSQFANKKNVKKELALHRVPPTLLSWSERRPPAVTGLIPGRSGPGVPGSHMSGSSGSASRLLTVIDPQNLYIYILCI